MTENIAVLGSTGSVGSQALDVCKRKGIRVSALSAGRDISKLEEQIRLFRPDFCAVAEESSARDLKIRVSDVGVKILSGPDAASEVASLSSSDTVLNAVSGVAGLRPTLSAISSGKKLALANKESLVVGGELVTSLAREKGVQILPVDSEHSAIFQCLTGQRVKRLILTASGGPFFGKRRSDWENISPSEALSHPTWSMGARITIDSSTMMNKGFEVIEAVRLFGLPPESVEVVVHRESIIHSMVEYIDNAILAQLGSPDMRLCIQYALTWPERSESPVSPLDFTTLSTLSFSPPDFENFPLLPFAYEALRRGGLTTSAMNGADEEAVSLFLSGQIPFVRIPELVMAASLSSPSGSEIKNPTLSDIEEADRAAREFVRRRAGARG